VPLGVCQMLKLDCSIHAPLPCRCRREHDHLSATDAHCRGR
jgi:hypothetical protein